MQRSSKAKRDPEVTGVLDIPEIDTVKAAKYEISQEATRSYGGFCADFRRFCSSVFGMSTLVIDIIMFPGLAL